MKTKEICEVVNTLCVVAITAFTIYFLWSIIPAFCVIVD